MRALLAFTRVGSSYEQATDSLYPRGKAELEEDMRKKDI